MSETIEFNLTYYGQKVAHVFVFETLDKECYGLSKASARKSTKKEEEFDTDKILDIWEKSIKETVGYDNPDLPCSRVPIGHKVVTITNFIQETYPTKNLKTPSENGTNNALPAASA